MGFFFHIKYNILMLLLFAVATAAKYIFVRLCFPMPTRETRGYMDDQLNEEEHNKRP